MIKNDRSDESLLLRSIPFILVHLACGLVLWVGVSKVALLCCLTLYLIRMFAITAGYHRYFSHRSYKTGRIFQFIIAFIGASSAQRGPLWWASHHRHHHQHSDTAEDIHSPRLKGFWWSQVGWIHARRYVNANLELVRDFLKYPELVALDRFHLIAPLLLASATFSTGWLLGNYFPHYNTSGSQLFVWGFCVSTVLLYHGTFAVNTWGHIIGRRRFRTSDDSKNSLILALITLGEGWHNNHHRYPGSERQGFYWWEIDITHYLLKILSWIRVVWDLRSPPARVYAEAKLPIDTADR